MSNDYAYAKKWRIERERGLTRTKPADKTAAHVDALRKAGWSYRGIADAVGVSVQTINLVHRGLQKKVANKTEQLVLALRADSIYTRSNTDESERCYGCDNPKSTAEHLEVIKTNIGLCNAHWNHWINKFFGTGYAPCAAHLIKESGNE